MQNAVCDGVAECRRAVRYQAKMGADVIKVTITGGFGSNTKLLPQMFADELKAIIDTAHQLDLKIAAHAYHPQAIYDAAAEGIDSIEHGFLVSDEGLKLMKKNGTFLVPTISASYPPPFLRIPNPPSVRLRNEYAAFERAYKMGVKIAFGTDAGTFRHGDNAKEFDLMVRYGMTAEDAIRSATVVTADLFGIDDIGTLEPGKLADIIAVKVNPLDDITALHEIDFVIKSGQIAKRDGAMLEGMPYPPMTDFGPDGP
jgi:imidazolonepropionase-like amidohydrolase